MRVIEHPDPTQVTATALFSSVLKNVTFEREGEPIALQTYDIPLKFAQPNNQPRITKVLLDPTYIEPTSDGSDPDDFTFSMRVKVADDQTTYSSFALAKWQSGKTTAQCSIEDDGGAFTLVVLARGATLAQSKFAISVPADGFYIGTNEGGEPDSAILVRGNGAAVNVPIAFS